MPTKRKNAHIAWPTTKGDAQNAFMKYVFCLFYLVAFCVDEPTFFIVFFFFNSFDQLASDSDNGI